MDDCPPVQELAAQLEQGVAEPELLEHIESCEACQASLTALREEIQSLQISISELWFRERISCPEEKELSDWRSGELDGPMEAYVAFHVEELGCPFCQATVGLEEVRSSDEGRRRVTRSRERVGEATSVLRGSLRRRKSRSSGD